MSGRIVGVEALVRWNHPRHGLLGPEEFVPIAEQTGLIVPLTRWVLAAAHAPVPAWQEQGYELSVAVNLSARSFLDTALAVDIPQLLDAPQHRADAARARDHREHDHARPGARDATLERLSRARPRGSRSTTSAPATRRWPTSSGCRSTRSRSTSRSCSRWRRSTPTPRSCARRSSSPTTSACRSSPRASRTARSGGARPPRLRLRPGLLPVAAAPGRQTGPEARHGAGRRGPRRAPAAAPRRRPLTVEEAPPPDTVAPCYAGPVAATLLPMSTMNRSAAPSPRWPPSLAPSSSAWTPRVRATTTAPGSRT